MSLSNASSQTLSAPASPAMGGLAGTPTWDPRINPNPAWIHLGGMSGMEHLVEAAEARFGMAGPAVGGLAGTPPGSPRADSGTAPRQEIWSIAYGNPPPWLATAPLTRSNALRISTHQEFTAEELDGEGTPPGWPSIMAPRAGARDSHWVRPQFMEPLTTGSSAVSSPIDRGWGGAAGGHIGGIVLADYYPELVLPTLPPSIFEPHDIAVLPPSTPVPTHED